MKPTEVIVEYRMMVNSASCYLSEITSEQHVAFDDATLFQIQEIAQSLLKGIAKYRQACHELGI